MYLNMRYGLSIIILIVVCRYKNNLKALYVVHPSWWLKVGIIQWIHIRTTAKLKGWHCREVDPPRRFM